MLLRVCPTTKSSSRHDSVSPSTCMLPNRSAAQHYVRFLLQFPIARGHVWDGLFLLILKGILRLALQLLLKLLSLSLSLKNLSPRNKTMSNCCKGPGYASPLEAMKGPREALIYVTCVYNGYFFFIFFFFNFFFEFIT